VTVSALEPDIDKLYQGPLGEFVSARTALAKSLNGTDAQRVRALQKPAAVAWAVNQVYWHARPTYDRLIKSGKALRSAQIAALGGKSADVRGAGETHRAAIAGAVREARRLAESSGVRPDADALARTFEALSLATGEIERDGRLTKPLSPAGFEALAGVTVKGHLTGWHQQSPPAETVKGREKERKAEQEQAEANRRKQEQIRDAQASLEQAQQAEATARADWERRKRDLDAARQALDRLQSS
jgi:hypothetical protein